MIGETTKMSPPALKRHFRDAEETGVIPTWPFEKGPAMDGYGESLGR
jgi:hypothetical protein